MSAMTDYLENKLLDHVLRSTSYTAPSAIWLGLYTATPSDAGGGTEVSGGAYTRVRSGAGTTSWNASQGGTAGASTGTGGQTSNSNDATFPTPSGANWGTVTHFGIFDASSSGNLLFWGALTASKPINNGDAAPKFLAGSLTVTFA